VPSGRSAARPGPVGAGKSYVAQALAHLAIRVGADARFLKANRALARLTVRTSTSSRPASSATVRTPPDCSSSSRYKTRGPGGVKSRTLRTFIPGTNAIESLNACYRRVGKASKHFPPSSQGDVECRGSRER